MSAGIDDAAPMLDPTDGAALARLAAAAVAARLTRRPLTRDPRAGLAGCSRAASFVTLERRGKLRGCVGTLEATHPLWQDVTRNAIRAMSDPRLPPVDTDDWPWLDVTVSVLSALEPVPVRVASDLQALVAILRPGIDGLLVADAERRALFLPSVWRKEPEPARFLSSLLAKGGWPTGCWPRTLTVRRYTATEFYDPSPRAPLAGKAG